VKEHDTKSAAACQQFFAKDQPWFVVGKQSGRQTVWKFGIELCAPRSVCRKRIQKPQGSLTTNENE